MIIGVLSIQGSFSLHAKALKNAVAGRDIEVRTVRRADDLSGINGLIIPGGESTTIGMLLERYEILEPLRRAIKNGLPVFGTCAGAILLSDTIADYGKQVHLGGIPMTSHRNAYGRQIASFDTELDFQGKKIPGVFIRAPKFSDFNSNEIETLSSYEEEAVAIKHNNIVAASFHPELTDNTAMHEYFIDLCSTAGFTV